MSLIFEQKTPLSSVGISVWKSMVQNDTLRLRYKDGGWELIGAFLLGQASPIEGVAALFLKQQIVKPGEIFLQKGYYSAVIPSANLSIH